MKAKKTKTKTTNDYIADFPKDVQAVLRKVKATIKKAAPGAQETISYGIPAFNLNGQYLIYYAGYKKHVGIYPIPGGDAQFRKRVAPYVAGKGTLRFPLEEPIPYALITKVVKIRIKENRAKAAAKRKKA
jgi:uncharacterized protein YdhG (YjbR/CyaY superfamily)